MTLSVHLCLQYFDRDAERFVATTEALGAIHGRRSLLLRILSNSFQPRTVGMSREMEARDDCSKARIHEFKKMMKTAGRVKLTRNLELFTTYRTLK